MRAFGNYILSGRRQAIGMIGFFSILSLLIPPATFIASGAPIGLVTLRKGAYYSAQVLIGSVVLMSVFALLVGLDPLLSLVILITMWLPVWICSNVLRLTEKPAKMALTAATIATAYVLFMYGNFGDVEQWWRLKIGHILDAGFATISQDEVKQLIENAPALMNALVASSIVLSLTSTVLLARWWQSALFNPGGFSTEFHVFCLPKQLALPATIGTMVLFFSDKAFTPLLRDILVIMVVLYLYQGIASIHRTVKSKGLSRNCLIGMYCLLAVIPQAMVIFVAWIGMTDSLLSVKIKDDTT